MRKKSRTPKPLEGDALLARLQTLTPSIAFTTSKTRDPYFKWDGDGPDPERRGLYPYDVDVTVRAIADGKLVEASAYLGGSYYREDERLGDIHGYLPQKLEEAADDLLKHPNLSPQTINELHGAIGFLKGILRQPYDAQRP